MTRLLYSRRTVTPLVATVVLALFAFAPKTETRAAGCPAGFRPADAEREAASGRDAGEAGKANAPSVCLNDLHPESLEDLEAMALQRDAIRTAPDGFVPAGAFLSALDQKAALSQNRAAENIHMWEPIGAGPLESSDPGYSSVNTNGLVDLAGRITGFAYVPRSDRNYPDTLLASVSYGGVWMTDSSVSNWTSIGDSLPTQVVGAVGYTPYGGGTIIALTGDGSFGRYSREGAGAYYTTDTGRHWIHSSGIPDEAFGFHIAVDKAHPNLVYAATGSGLYRSADGGRSFANVKLPTGSCAGKSNRVKACLLANEVTDVVVMAPGGKTNEKGGRVLAAVGWRGGNRANPDGSIQSAYNGLFRSDTGAPGTFVKLSTVGFPSQARIGRTELGEATGPAQDHNIVYAEVQDAVLVRNGLPAIDAPGDTYDQACNQVKPLLPAHPLGGAYPICPLPTALNGIYVSRDWGQTWVLMADANELEAPGTGSALTPSEALAGGYGPGVQSWYNEWIKPDPTQTDAVTGAPTRMFFGLEEVWENVNTGAPLLGPTAFKVIGRYFAGTTCVSILNAGDIVQGLVGVTNLSLPCPTNGTEALLHETTTHPDQHDGIIIPTRDGVTLVVGNDGGAYKQSVLTGADFSNANWGDGANRGFNTLLPYDVARAKDGTVWMGLQDNGSAKIVNVVRDGRVVQKGRIIETIGGDGFFVAVDPNNGNVAYEEYVGGAMSATNDGGYTWSGMSPPITDGQFSTPFVMDPLDARHLEVAGRQIVETGSGSGTSANDWKKVFDLGTRLHFGSASATASATDPVNSMTAIDLYGANSYVGFCNVCAPLNSPVGFQSGLVTNVGGSKRPARYSSNGWHRARAIGLPNRYITGISIDPSDPRSVYVSVGGYQARWTPPNFLDKNANVGRGHVFVSRDAGDHFTDISGDLPNMPANWVTRRGSQVIVATDIGVFISPEGESCATDCHYQLLGNGLPAAPVFTVHMAPGDPNLLIAAAYGRGAWSYRFGPAPKQGPAAPAKPLPPFLGKLLGSFDFETSDQGWTSSSTSPAEAWRRLPPGSGSSNSFQLTPYTNQATATLTSSGVNVPAESLIKIQWDQRLDTEACCDFFTLDWSIGGKLWHSATAVAGKNPAWPNFTTVSTQFVVPKGTLYVRFRLTSDQLVSFPPYTGVAVDNVIIKR